MNRLPERCLIDIRLDRSKLVEVSVGHPQAPQGITSQWDFLEWPLAYNGVSDEGSLKSQHENLPIIQYEEWLRLKDLSPLPEKWVVKGTSVDGLEPGDVVYDYFIKVGGEVNAIAFYNDYYYYNVIGKDGLVDTKVSKRIPASYEEIDFDSFLEYIVEPVMYPEVIGYKFKPNCEKYRSAANNIISDSFNLLKIKPATRRTVATETYKELKESGVLDLWFEPIYLQEFEVGDYFLVMDARNSNCNENRVYRVRKIENGNLYFDDENYVSRYLCQKPSDDEFERYKPIMPRLSGYRGEDKGSYVEFGCKKFQKDLVLTVYDLMKSVWNSPDNSRIQAVMVGDNNIYFEDLKEIVDYLEFYK